MRPPPDRAFDLSPKEAVLLQRELAGRVETRNRLRKPRTVAGADIALSRRAGRGYAGVVTYALDGLEELERASASGPLTFPYVPGLLSFREGPLLVRALERLRRRPDVVLFDGQGFAHPRRFGLACHLGVLLDVPAVGVAKSRLCGEHLDPGPRRGARVPLVDEEETIGAVLRTRDRVKPLFVSVGHRVSLETAVDLVLACHDGTRVPKPTREADRFVAALKRSDGAG